MSNQPFFPAIDPWVMPADTFDTMISQYGVNMQWMKSHNCPCVYGGDIPGSPDSKCKQCGGKGIYWDAPSSTFVGLLTYMHTAQSPDEPGSIMDTKYGAIQRAEPLITIPYSAGDIWSQASQFDAYIEVDAINRFNATLTVSGETALPYQQNATVAATGAVHVYDQNSHTVSATDNYTFASGSVVLGSGYAEGTAYTVEYTAAPVYVAWRKAGGMPHSRPFGAQELKLPRRFHLSMLDLWLRARDGASSSLSPNAL